MAQRAVTTAPEVTQTYKWQVKKIYHLNSGGWHKEPLQQRRRSPKHTNGKSKKSII